MTAVGNLLDYLSERGKIPFSVTPFYSVDALLLAMLAYVDFTGIVPENGGEVPLRKACRAYFSSHVLDSPWKPRNYAERPALVLARMSDCPRFAGLTFSHYTQSRDSDSQFGAVTIRPGDGSLFVAFRGTDASISGWKESFSLSYLDATPGQRRALAYLNAVGPLYPQAIQAAGHSKGGNCAVYAAAFCQPAVRDRVERIFIFDAPGFREDLAASPEIAAILPRLVSILPDASLVGRLLTRVGEGRTVKSNARGLLQHDPATWEIRDGQFADKPANGMGDYLDQTFRRWLEGLDNETRRSFTETLFSLLASAGADSFEEMGLRKRRSAGAILTALRELPREKRREALAVIGALLRSGGAAAASCLSRRITGRKDR